MNKLPKYLYWSLIIGAVVHSVFYYSQMPGNMASHFGGGGKADNWAAKQAFFIGAAIMLLFSLGIFILIPWLFQRFRIVKMNLPNRDYWLAPERIDEVYRYFREKMCWFGIVNTIFGIGIMHLVFIANLGTPQVLDSFTFMWLLAGYFVFVIIWLVSFYAKFRKTD